MLFKVFFSFLNNLKRLGYSYGTMYIRPLRRIIDINTLISEIERHCLYSGLQEFCKDILVKRYYVHIADDVQFASLLIYHT